MHSQGNLGNSMSLSHWLISVNLTEINSCKIVINVHDCIMTVGAHDSCLVRMRTKVLLVVHTLSWLLMQLNVVMQEPILCRYSDGTSKCRCTACERSSVNSQAYHKPPGTSESNYSC